MGMDSEVLSPSDVAGMAPVSTKALEFPRWEVPTWSQSPDSDRQDLEYFDATGRLVGGLRPFASKWSAWKFAGTAVTDNSSHVTGHDVGIYYTKEQGMKAVEDLA